MYVCKNVFLLIAHSGVPLVDGWGRHWPPPPLRCMMHIPGPISVAIFFILFFSDPIGGTCPPPVITPLIANDLWITETFIFIHNNYECSKPNHGSHTLRIVTTLPHIVSLSGCPRKSATVDFRYFNIFRYFPISWFHMIKYLRRK